MPLSLSAFVQETAVGHSWLDKTFEPWIFLVNLFPSYKLNSGIHSDNHRVGDKFATLIDQPSSCSGKFSDESAACACSERAHSGRLCSKTRRRQVGRASAWSLCASNRGETVVRMGKNTEDKYGNDRNIFKFSYGIFVVLLLTQKKNFFSISDPDSLISDPAF